MTEAVVLSCQSQKNLPFIPRNAFKCADFNSEISQQSYKL